jgi:tight adherence protein C
MNAMDHVIAVLVFVMVAGITVYLWTLAERVQRSRLIRRRVFSSSDDLREEGARGLIESFFEDVVVPLGRIAAPKGADALADTTRKIRQAGYTSSRFPVAFVFFGLRAFTALFLGVLQLVVVFVSGSFGAMSLLHLFFPLGVGYCIPSMLLNRQASARSKRILKELPDVLDLLKICIEAGLSLDSSLYRVHKELRGIAPVLSKELSQYFLEVQSGLPRREVLGALAERNQVNALTGVVNLFLQSSRLGTDIAEALDVYSRSLRTERIQTAEEQGGKVAAKLTLPMIFLILPALLIVILGPAVINMLERLHTMQ